MLSALTAILAMSGATQENSCAPPWTSQQVVTCALSRSPEVQRAEAELAALAGRRTSEARLLSSNPTLALTGAQRRALSGESEAAGTTVLNWTATLSQEVELAGQRSARLDAVNGERKAQAQRVWAARQSVSWMALRAWQVARVSEEAARLASDAATITASLARVAAGRATEQLVSQVDADTAAAEAWRLSLAKLEAERRRDEARAELLSILGTAAPPVVTALSEPLVLPPTALLLDQALQQRGDVGAARAETEAAAGRRRLAQRQRVPNTTLSLFAQSDGFRERVLGVGVSFPIPVWSTGAGEAQEALDRVTVAEKNAESVQRQVQLEVERAALEYRSRVQAARALPPLLVTRAHGHLEALATGLRAGQLSIRDALLSERSLLEFLSSELDARLALSLSELELRRAAALPFFEASR